MIASFTRTSFIGIATAAAASALGPLSMASAAGGGATLAHCLHGLHGLRSAHFLSLLAEPIGVVWCDTTGLFDALVECLQPTSAFEQPDPSADVRIGMLLMDYRAQAAATKTPAGSPSCSLKTCGGVHWDEDWH